MQKTSHSLEAGLGKMVRALAALNDLMASSPDQQSCWATLLTIRELDSARARQSGLLGQYREHFASTHWTINIVLRTSIEQLQTTGLRIQNILDELYRLLQESESTVPPSLQNQLQGLCAGTQSLLDTEHNVLFKMLDLMIPAPQPPVTRTRPGPVTYKLGKRRQI